MQHGASVKTGTHDRRRTHHAHGVPTLAICSRGADWQSATTGVLQLFKCATYQNPTGSPLSSTRQNGLQRPRTPGGTSPQNRWGSSSGYGASRSRTDLGEISVCVIGCGPRAGVRSRRSVRPGVSSTFVFASPNYPVPARCAVTALAHSSVLALVVSTTRS
jgi:hypothetical protein